jgi:hypothetical protein
MTGLVIMTLGILMGRILSLIIAFLQLIVVEAKTVNVDASSSRS